MALPGHALELPLSQITKLAQITHPGDIKKGTGWRGHMGHSLVVSIVNALPHLFLDLWSYWNVRTSGWTEHSCEETLSHHLYSPPSVNPVLLGVKTPYSEMGCSVLSEKWVVVLHLLSTTK